MSPYGVWIATRKYTYWRINNEVSVPLRGVDCYLTMQTCRGDWRCFRPLTGCDNSELVELFDKLEFPSPYGVWIATATFI